MSAVGGVKRQAAVGLDRVAEVHLEPSVPFAFDLTLFKPDHFPTADSMWQPGVRWQTMRWEGQPLGLRFENSGQIDAPGLNLSIWAAGELPEGFLNRLLVEIRYRYNLQYDLTDFYKRFEGHLLLGPLLKQWRGMRFLNYHSLYEYLVIAIVLQNAVVRRSIQMMQVLLENHGTLVRYAGQELYCLWAPEDLAGVAEEELRALKVGYRAKSIRRVSEAFAARQVDEAVLRRQSREEQRAALLRLYGIGPASAGYILTDVFHHLDELEHIAPWEQKIYSRIFFGRDPDHPAPVADLLQYLKGEFGDFCALAVHYFWEDLFWRWSRGQAPWLDALIRR